MAIKWYSHVRRGRVAGRQYAAATISTTGNMSINAAAMSALGNPDYLQVGYDSDTNQLAFRPVAALEAGAYVVRRYKSIAPKSAQIVLRTILTHFEIDITINRAYRLIESSRGVFTLNLSAPLE